MDGPGRSPAVHDVLAAALVALALVVAITGGFTIDVAGARVGLHSWARVAIAVAVVVGARGWWARVGSSGHARILSGVEAVVRPLLAGGAVASIGYWIFYLSTICGGSDSYGYVSASRLLLDGRLIVTEPAAEWLPGPDPLAVATPAAYVPAAGGRGIAPGYPLGLPALMAVATLGGGSLGPYLVAPLCGVVCLVLAWRLGTAWYGPAAGALAAALVAWEPLVVTYAKQPMSDMPATMWILLAVWWLQPATAHPFLAGLTTGAAFMTRPGGIGAIAVVVLLAALRREGRWPRFMAFAAGAVPLAVAQALLQWHLYGSPFASGYGRVAALYAGGSLWANLGIYADGLWRPRSWIWFAGVAAAWLAPSKSPAALATGMLAASAVPYLLYFEFDHWETLRFVLPSIVLLTIVAAGGLATAAARFGRPAVPVVLLLAAVVSTWHGERFLRAQEVPRLRDADTRYTRVAARLARTTPENAVVLAMQHSGSIRHYANRLTLRFDVIRPEDLEATLDALAARGRPAYVALEGIEQQQFERRFAEPLTRVRRLPVGQDANVQIWQLDRRPPA